MAYQGQIDTSGMAATLSQYVNPAESIGKFAQQYGERLRRDEEVAYQKDRDAKADARLKVQDDRVATEWEQRQAAFNRAELLDKAIGGAIVGTPTTLQQGQSQEQPQGTILTPSNTTVPQGEVTKDGTLLGAYHPGTTPSVIQVQGKGGFSNANPDIPFNKAVTVSPSPKSPYNGNLPTPNQLINYDDATKHNSPNALAIGAINKQYDGKLSDLKNGMQGAGLKASLTHSLEDQKIYDSVSGKYKTLLAQKDAAIKGLDNKPTVTNKLLHTTLNDIDLSTPYDSNGNKIGDKLLPSQNHLTQVYFKDKKSGELVNSQDYDKGLYTKLSSYLPGAITEKVKPGTPAYYDKVAGTTNPTIPTNTGDMKTSTFVNKVDKAVGTEKNSDIFNPATPTRAEQVTSISNGLIEKLLKENPSLRYSEVSKAVIEAVNQRIPSGSMTDTEQKKWDASQNKIKYDHETYLHKIDNEVSTNNNIRTNNTSILNNQNTNRTAILTNRADNAVKREGQKVKESAFLKSFDEHAGKLQAEKEADPIGTADRIEEGRRKKFAGRWQMKYGDEGWYDEIFHNKSDWIDNQIAEEDAKITQDRAKKSK
jgi:hypothetical protein